MESFIKGLGDAAPPEKNSTTTEEEEKLFRDAWNQILEPSTSTPTPAVPANPVQSSQKGPEVSFQERVRQTMEKMKEGQSSLKVRGLFLRRYHRLIRAAR
jgi:hypothetical protein